MSEMPSNAPIMESRPGPAGWLPVWIKAVTKPNEQTFIDITETPEATSKTAFIWAFIAGVVVGVMQAILQTVNAALGLSPQPMFPGMEQFSQSGSGGVEFAGMQLVVSLCLIPVFGVLSVVFLAIFTAITQWIAKLFGGVGTFEKLAYGLAAINMPIILVSSVLNVFTAIPLVGLCVLPLSIILSLYALVLLVMAVKAVNRFGWGQAVGSIFILPVTLIFCSCIIIGGLMLSGPVIGDVFSEINQSLQNAP